MRVNVASPDSLRLSMACDYIRDERTKFQRYNIAYQQGLSIETLTERGVPIPTTYPENEADFMPLLSRLRAKLQQPSRAALRLVCACS